VDIENQDINNTVGKETGIYTSPVQVVLVLDSDGL